MTWDFPQHYDVILCAAYNINLYNIKTKLTRKAATLLGVVILVDIIYQLSERFLLVNLKVLQVQRETEYHLTSSLISKC